ncbi:MAG: VacJ family lipoprotein [Pseudomonadota bacterium]
MGVRIFSRWGGAALLLAAAACTAGPDPDDPYEATNRSIHEFNKAVDRNALRPVSDVYATAVPRPARTGVSNAVSNIGEPVAFINHTLQGDFDDAGATFFRFAVNTVFGFAGLLDVATDAGIFERETDFGETLAVWGVPPGAYLEVPFFGPSTERDLFGTAVNIGINPTTYLLGGQESLALVGAQAADILNQRQEFGAIIDALFYESADSYTAAKIAYLQNRAQATAADGISEDILEDPYAFE